MNTGFYVMYYNQMTTKELMQQAIDEGGMTLTTESNKPIKIKFQDGYQVSKTGIFFENMDEALQELNNLINQRKDSDSWYIGLWHDDNKLWIEPSYHYEDLELANMDGLRFNQQSIFDWTNHESIPVKDINDMTTEELSDYMTYLIVAKMKGGE